MKRTKDAIHIAQSLAANSAVADVIAIPMGCVKKVERL